MPSNLTLIRSRIHLGNLLGYLHGSLNNIPQHTLLDTSFLFSVDFLMMDWNLYWKKIILNEISH